MPAKARTAVLDPHPDLHVDVDLQTAGPVPALIQESDRARLLVPGSRGRGGFTGILVGSTAVALVAHGHCPVAVIRGRSPDEAPPTTGPVVVGVDGSTTSETALATAFDEASFRGANLVAVHAWNGAGADRAHAHARRPAAERDAVEGREHELLAERMAGWQDKYPDVTVRRVVTEDLPRDLPPPRGPAGRRVVNRPGEPRAVPRRSRAIRPCLCGPAAASIRAWIE